MARREKIARLENDYTKKVRQTHRKKAILTARRKKRALMISGFFVVLGLIFGVQIIHAKWSLKQTIVAMSQSQKQLVKEKADSKVLKKEVALLNNRDYLDKLIRAKYYYAKPDETIYSLPDEASDMGVK